MILALVLFFLLAGTLVADDRVPTVSGRDADRAAITAHIDSIFRAYIAKDREKIRETHGKHWRGFVRPSRTVVRGIDQYMQAADRILAGPARVVSYQMRELDIVFYGDTGLVSYIADMKVDVDGREHDDVLRVLDVYVKEGGHWNQVASNVASHPEALEAQRQQAGFLPADERSQLLREREAVWRAYFNNDQAALEKVLPAELVGVNAGEEKWVDRSATLVAASQFAQSGGKLLRLAFPRTDIQLYGDTAVLYTTYEYDLEIGGKRESAAGRGTEIFVRRNGHWVNSGWHLDSGK